MARGARGQAAATWFVVVGYGCFVLLYALLIPRWLPMDELGHFYYVGHLVDPGRYPLPVPTHYEYEIRQQPPLAYLLYAPFLKMASGLALAQQLLCLRLVSVVIGIATVYVTMRLLALLFGDGPDRGVLLATAGAIMAFNPAFLAVSSTVTNDGLLALLGALVTLQAARLASAPVPARRDALLLCLLIGLACETKALALALLPLPVLVWWWRRRCYPLDVGAARHLIVNVAIMVALAAPPYLVRLVVYRDPFGTGYMHALAHYRPPSLARIRAFPAHVLENYWLFTSYLRGVLLPQPSTAEAVPFALLSICPCWLLWRRAGDTPRLVRSGAQLIGLTVVVLTMGAFVVTAVSIFTPQGRYLFMAIGPISWLITLGIHAFAQRIGDRRQILPRLVLIYMLVYSTMAALRYLAPAPDIFRTFSF